MNKTLVRETISQETLNETFKEVDLHPLTLRLLLQRGITTKESALEFINPSYENHVGNPFDIFGMDIAVSRVIDAMKKGETIAIYSDYDCDGIPGGVLLRTFFDDIGYPIEMYVPHRHNEGYGINIKALDGLKKKGVTLMITVDLAITNIDEVAYAKSLGIDVIVTDHHLPVHNSVTETYKGVGKVVGAHIVPDAVAVLNSKQDACTYQDDMLCGCAVAWKLACALLVKLREESAGVGKFGVVTEAVSHLRVGYEKWLLDLVGISTVSDMVPLVKENRALAYFGLKVLRQTKRHGLNQIFRAQGISKEHLTEEDIAFTIAPRINAAGRMGDPIQAHRMLYEKDSVTAQGYVEDLEALNMERKQSVKDITEGISFDHAVYGNDVIAVGDLSWGPGILGLIAQKIIDETGKPTFVWGQGDDKTTIKGSCRSKGDVHVVDLMARAQELFPEVITHFGGHEQAGGFSCALDKVNELSNALNASLQHVEVKKLENDSLVADALLSLGDVTLVTHNAVSVLAPFGVGNPKPLFLFDNIEPLSVRWFGKKGEHIEVVYPRKVGEKLSELKAIMFFASKELALRAGRKHSLLAHIEKSVFRGKTELRLRIKDIV